MKSYLELAAKYLNTNKKKTRLAIISVAISVALVTGIFSMFDVFLKFEKQQMINDYGNFHLAIQNPSNKEIKYIKSRIDVQNSGKWKGLDDVVIKGTICKLGALDESFAPNMNIRIIAGDYPKAENEIMLEKWAMESLYLNTNIGERIILSFSENVKKEYIVSGIYNDFGSLKAAGIPGVFMSVSGASALESVKTDLYLVEFKNRVNINNAVNDIKNVLNISSERISLNNHLLAVIGQSKHKAAMGLYTIGGILFGIVLTAGVVMIYNTFNISVMERVRQFGLLRCVGATQSQIKKLVKREGLMISLFAIPLGILAGMMITLLCSAILKYYNQSIFGEIALFNISIIGITAGILVGFLTVIMASFLPAHKAARVSPLNAVTGSNEVKISRRKKKGLLTRVFPADLALGINNAFLKKRTLILMSCSIALSIIMFLGFNVFIDFMYSSLKTTKPYTPDISLTSEQGIDEQMFLKLNELSGVKNVYGRMFAYVDTTFDANRLTDLYKEEINQVPVKNNGLFVPPEKSWLISYDKQQLNWAKLDLLEGELSQEKMNQSNGVIAVVQNLRKNISMETVNLQLGDKVYIETPAGTKELTVMGILKNVPFSSNDLTLTAFITTEKLFAELTGDAVYKAVDIQLKKKNDEHTAASIKEMVNEKMTLKDLRQRNADINQTFLTMAVFVYGFVAVIALISILNIINTINTSVASKTRYLGVMRAVGMSGKQLDKMVFSEAAVYSINGCLAGCILGVVLQKILIENYLSHFHIKWQFPLWEIIFIVVLTFLVTMGSVIHPLKKIKAKGISEIISSL